VMGPLSLPGRVSRADVEIGQIGAGAAVGTTISPISCACG
jgi:hypothetical protein